MRGPRSRPAASPPRSLTDPVRAIADLAEEELGLVATGRYDELNALHVRRAAALAALPATPSATEREVLARAHHVQVQVTALLERALGETSAHLTRLDRGQAALRGYARALKGA